MPLAVDNIEQVKIARLFGVIFSGNLNFDEHVTFVLSICSQRLYLIRLLRSQGIPESKLHVIFVALIISRILYALSAWGGFLNSQQINRINAQTSFANPLLYHEVYFISFDYFHLQCLIYSVLYYCMTSAFIICFF